MSLQVHLFEAHIIHCYVVVESKENFADCLNDLGPNTTMEDSKEGADSMMIEVGSSK